MLKGRGTEWTLAAFALVAVLVLVLLPGQPGRHPRYLNEKCAVRSLREYATAQEIFSVRGAVSGEEQGYWRRDIAGLHALQRKDGSALQLIDLSTASADGKPLTPLGKVYGSEVIASAKGGYWFVALALPGEKLTDLMHYAACAYPSSPSAGRWMYLIRDKSVLYRKEFQGSTVPTVFPEHPESEGWDLIPGNAEY